MQSVAYALTLQSAKNISSLVEDIAETAAIVIAGVWGYYKFVKGRLFSSRADWSVATSIVELDGRALLRVRATLANTGTALIVLDEPPVRQRLEFLTPGGVALAGSSQWVRVAPADDRPSTLFAGQFALESGESAVDETLLPLPGLAPDVMPQAWRLTLTVFVRRRALSRKRRLIARPASVVIIGEEQS